MLSRNTDYGDLQVIVNMQCAGEVQESKADVVWPRKEARPRLIIIIIIIIIIMAEMAVV